MKGRQAILASFQQWLEILREPPPAAEDAFGPDDPPTLGRAIARTLVSRMASDLEGNVLANKELRVRAKTEEL
jgi:hypothetical protein